MEVNTKNTRVGLRVRINPKSEFARQDRGYQGQRNGKFVVGVIESVDKKSINNDTWCLVNWGYTKYNYRLGPNYYDLETNGFNEYTKLIFK